MKKHLFGIFTYFATFILSFFLVALLTEKPVTKVTTNFPNRAFLRSPNTASETEQQTRIKNLLLRDQEMGFEYFAGTENAGETEELARQMKALDASDLPAPVRKSYAAHAEAWENFAKHLSGDKDHVGSDRECKVLNRRINLTYDTLLLSAKNYGVDFPR